MAEERIVLVHHAGSSGRFVAVNLGVDGPCGGPIRSVDDLARACHDVLELGPNVRKSDVQIYRVSVGSSQPDKSAQEQAMKADPLEAGSLPHDIAGSWLVATPAFKEPGECFPAHPLVRLPRL
jgi:hypothetical protein